MATGRSEIAKAGPSIRATHERAQLCHLGFGYRRLPARVALPELSINSMSKTMFATINSKQLVSAHKHLATIDWWGWTSHTDFVRFLKEKAHVWRWIPGNNGGTWEKRIMGDGVSLEGSNDPWPFPLWSRALTISWRIATESSCLPPRVLVLLTVCAVIVSLTIVGLTATGGQLMKAIHSVKSRFQGMPWTRSQPELRRVEHVCWVGRGSRMNIHSGFNCLVILFLFNFVI